MNLEAFLLWQVYMAALLAQKKREHRHLARDRHWLADLRVVQQHLGTLGLTL